MKIHIQKKNNINNKKESIYYNEEYKKIIEKMKAKKIDFQIKGKKIYI